MRRSLNSFYVTSSLSVSSSDIVGSISISLTSCIFDSLRFYFSLSFLRIKLELSLMRSYSADRIYCFETLLVIVLPLLLLYWLSTL